METVKKIEWSKVKTWRNAGIECKWGRSHNRPAMFLKPSHSQKFFLLTKAVLESIQANFSELHNLKDAVNLTLSVSDVFCI